MKKALFTLCLIVATARASAETYAIDWHSIDAGGGTSTGTVYSVSGSIGQPDAGTMSGGGYLLVGGFWSVVSALQMADAPLLSIERLPGAARVYWPNSATGFVLEQSLTVTGAWSQVAFPYHTNATDISISLSPPMGNRFYRLRKP